MLPGYDHDDVDDNDDDGHTLSAEETGGGICILNYYGNNAPLDRLHICFSLYLSISFTLRRLGELMVVLNGEGVCACRRCTSRMCILLRLGSGL